MITREQLRDIVSEYAVAYGTIERLLATMEKRMMDLEDIISDIIIEQGETE